MVCVVSALTAKRDNRPQRKKEKKSHGDVWSCVCCACVGVWVCVVCVEVSGRERCEMLLDATSNFEKKEDSRKRETKKESKQLNV